MYKIKKGMGGGFFLIYVFYFFCFFFEAGQAGRLFVFPVVDDEPEGGLVGLVGVETEEALGGLPGQTNPADVDLITVADKRNHVAILRDRRFVVPVDVEFASTNSAETVHLTPGPRFGNVRKFRADVGGRSVPLLSPAEVLFRFNAGDRHWVTEARFHDRFLAVALLHGC